MGIIRASGGMNQHSYPLPIVASSVGSLNKPSYSKESLATVVMLMSIIIITCTATVTRWLAVTRDIKAIILPTIVPATVGMGYDF